MFSKINTNMFEKFTNDVVAQNENKANNVADLPVDHCRLRPLNEIKSTMCEPTPIPTTIPLPTTIPPTPTTICIEPAVKRTNAVGVEEECALYRYESPEKIINTLKKKGFYVFRNMISPLELNVAKKYFYGNLVNYNRLRDRFINPFMLKKVGKEIDRNLVNIKYRASNNNNSSDAGAFHRDLHIKSGEERSNQFHRFNLH